MSIGDRLHPSMDNVVDQLVGKPRHLAELRYAAGPSDLEQMFAGIKVNGYAGSRFSILVALAEWSTSVNQIREF